MSRSPHVSQPRRRLPTGVMSAPGACSRRRRDQGCGRFVRFGHQPAAGTAAPLFERLQDERFLLRAHAFERLASALRARPRSSSSSVRMPQLAIEHRRRSSGRLPGDAAGRGSSAGTPAAVPGGRRSCRCRRARRSCAREILADAGNRQRAGWRQLGDGLARCGAIVGAVAIGADLERVLALDFEQIANLGEDPGDGQVIHGACTAAMSASRRAGRRARS